MFLCARKSKEPPEEPICDILVAGGPNRKTVMDSLKKRAGPFDFKEIRVFNPDKLHKNGFINQGLAYSQYGTWTRSEANLSSLTAADGSWHVQRQRFMACTAPNACLGRHREGAGAAGKLYSRASVRQA